VTWVVNQQPVRAGVRHVPRHQDPCYQPQLDVVAPVGDEAFVQSNLGALATGAVGDLQIELALPLGVHL